MKSGKAGWTLKSVSLSPKMVVLTTMTYLYHNSLFWMSHFASACYNLPRHGDSCNMHDWPFTLALWNIQSRLQDIQNINFDTQIDEFGQLGPAL